MTIGDGTIFGSNVLVYDHDHRFDAEGVSAVSFTYDEVTIGSGCWIGSGTILLKGTVIGDNSIVGAGCILKGKYDGNSLIIQKRQSVVHSLVAT